jgi:hypothetical protein
MTDSFRSTPQDQQWSGGESAAGHGATNGFKSYDSPGDSADGGDVGKALLVGVLGGLVSAAGYLIYRRLPDDQKERLNAQVRTLVQQRISELRQNFNI